jgi:hypothetical protein
MIESMIAAVDTAADSASSAGDGIVLLFVGLLLHYMPAILALAWTFTTPCTSSANDDLHPEARRHIGGGAKQQFQKRGLLKYSD